jgi:hypothetical protein
MGVTTLERAWRYIDSIPRAVSGQGGHDATFHVACVLGNGFGLGGDESFGLLARWNVGCVPEWSERDLRHKVESAARAPHREPRGYLLGKTGLEVPGIDRRDSRSPVSRVRTITDPVEAVKRFLKGFQCQESDLVERSRVKLDGDPRFDAALVTEHLYLAGERVNHVTEFVEDRDGDGNAKARPSGMGITLERDAAVRRFRNGQPVGSRAGGWLRMNPVDGRGVGDINVTVFRFVLLESDALPLDLQVSLLGFVPLPIAAILCSGGKSLHAWVKLDAKDAGDYRAQVGDLFRILAPLGFDGKNKNPSRLSRLPGARRQIGASGDGMQRLLYLNPAPTGERIFK